VFDRERGIGSKTEENYDEIWTDNLEDMVTIGLFLLIDSRFREYEEEIRQYFESHHKRADGYRMMQDEILLVIKKI